MFKIEDWMVVLAVGFGAVLLVMWLSAKANQLERDMLDSEPPQAERLKGITYGGRRVLQERWRQINREGYSEQHDANHRDGELAAAATAYATPLELRETLGWGVGSPFFWPWPGGWRPGNGSRAGRMRELEKAGALIIAELDRLHALEAAEIAALAAGRLTESRGIG